MIRTERLAPAPVHESQSDVSGSLRDALDIAPSVELPPRFHPPLSWWHVVSADAYRRSDIRTLRRVMRLSDEVDDPRWLDAMRGDAPTAISLAVRMRKSDDLRCRDLAMTALLCCALEGCASSAVLIAATLHDRLEPNSRALEASWLAADFSRWRPAPGTKDRRRKTWR